MKKILLFSAAALGISMAAHAQAEVNFQVIEISKPAAFTVINCNSNDSIDIEFKAVNVGPTNISTTDTILFISPDNDKDRGWIITGLSNPWNVNDTLTITHKFPATAVKNWGKIDTSGSAVRTYVADEAIPDNDTIGFNFTLSVSASGSFTVGTNNKGLYTPVIWNCNVSTNDINKSTVLSVYPNPTANNISFSYDFTSSNNATVRVMDLMGRTLITKDFGIQAVGTKNFTLDVATLSNGVYYVEMISGDVRGVSKFTVSK